MAKNLAGANWLAHAKSSRLYEFASYKFSSGWKNILRKLYLYFVQNHVSSSCDLLYTFLRKDTLVPFLYLMVSWCCDS